MMSMTREHMRLTQEIKRKVDSLDERLHLMEEKMMK